MTLKYARERALLQTVYDEEEFAVVKHQDSPDFVLQHRGAVTSFGVEVTEVFETEADARVRAYPDYIGRLLAGDRHIHRDDLEVLKVTRVSIHAPDGSLKSGNVPAIFRQAPTNQQHYEAVADRLMRKDTRIDTYSKGLSHVNLILAVTSDQPQSLGLMASTLLPTFLSRLFVPLCCERASKRYSLSQRMIATGGYIVPYSN
jgi:hypothetical protein